MPRMLRPDPMFFVHQRCTSARFTQPGRPPCASPGPAADQEPATDWALNEAKFSHRDGMITK
jgi:hypothetical protein